MTFTLIPGQPKVAFDRALCPGPREFAVSGTQVFNLPFRRNMNRTSGLVFALGFDADRPVRHIKKDASELYGIGAWINGAGDILSVPIHDQSQVIPLRRRWAPIAGPCAGQRVAFLRKR